MIAVILVGGEGTRLRPLTWRTPKSMVPVLNRPFLGHMLEHLHGHGITDIVLAVGANALADTIHGALDDGSAYGVRLTYSVEKEPLGSAGAFKLVDAMLRDETFVVLNGDIYTDLDLGAMIACIRREWHIIDATGQPLGRVATRAASLLRGKHKPDFTPNLDAGDSVIIVNADRVKLTGAKPDQKVYYRHSQYPGGLKATTLGTLMATRPVKVVEMAVRGMLPHNRLGRQVYKHLHVYGGPDHPHQAQVGNGAASANEGATE